MTKDKAYTVISSQSRTSSELSVIDRKTKKLRQIVPKYPNSRYFIEHNRGYFYLVTNDQAPDFKMVRVPEGGSLRQQEEFIPCEEGLCIDEVDMFREHIVIYCRDQGVPSIRVYDIKKGSFHKVELPGEVFSIEPGINMDYYSKEVRVIYSSPLVYEMTLAYNMDSKTLHKVNERKLQGAPLYPERFVVKRVNAVTHDGLELPITLFHRSDLKKDRKNKMLLTGYGAYGTRADHKFRYSQLTAVEDGWVVATPHVRGEGEKGVEWHKAATKHLKHNSFADFISAASFLVKEGYSQPKYIGGYGTSAGGLLLAQAVNLKPNLFNAVVLEVPFVDPLSVMQDENSPLTIPDRDEWGDPLADQQIFDEMRGYSPYDNLSINKYPKMLITAATNDQRVPLWSVLKYVKRLRERKLPDDFCICENNIAVDIQETGHFGEGSLESEAVVWAFLNTFIKTPVF